MVVVISLLTSIAFIVSIIAIMRPSDQIADNLRQSVTHYNESDAIYDMDAVQSEWECCGLVSGYDDYQTNQTQIQSCCFKLNANAECVRENAHQTSCLQRYFNGYDNLKFQICIYFLGVIIMQATVASLQPILFAKFKKHLSNPSKSEAFK